MHVVTTSYPAQPMTKRTRNIGPMQPLAPTLHTIVSPQDDQNHSRRCWRNSYRRVRCWRFVIVVEARFLLTGFGSGREVGACALGASELAASSRQSCSVRQLILASRTGGPQPDVRWETSSSHSPDAGRFRALLSRRRRSNPSWTSRSASTRPPRPPRPPTACRTARPARTRSNMTSVHGLDLLVGWAGPGQPRP